MLRPHAPRTLTAIAALALSTAPLFAASDLQITEIYAGITGEDGTEDWFELTNVGDVAIDTGGLYYDDESADPTIGGELSSIVLQPGESAVFLIDANDDDVLDFEAVWGMGIAVGTTDDGGGLSQGGDAVFLFESGDAGAAVVDSVAFGSLEFDPPATGIADVDGMVVAAVLGVDGAFESNAFFNDNIGDANDMITIIGSPGSFGSAVIPLPAPVLLFLSALLPLGALRRRHQENAFDSRD